MFGGDNQKGRSLRLGHIFEPDCLCLLTALARQDAKLGLVFIEVKRRCAELAKAIQAPA